MMKKTKLQLEEELQEAYRDLAHFRQKLLDYSNATEILKRMEGLTEEYQRMFERIFRSFDGQGMFTHAERRGAEKMIAGLVNEAFLDILSSRFPF